MTQKRVASGAIHTYILYSTTYTHSICGRRIRLSHQTPRLLLLRNASSKSPCYNIIVTVIVIDTVIDLDCSF
jgi:hypothetical protein